jgi:hypothetical protein
MHMVDVPDKDTDAAIAGQPFGFLRREEVQGNFVTAQARIKNRVSIFEGGSKAKRIAVMPILFAMSLTTNTVAASASIGCSDIPTSCPRFGLLAGLKISRDACLRPLSDVMSAPTAATEQP